MAFADIVVLLFLADAGVLAITVLALMETLWIRSRIEHRQSLSEAVRRSAEGD